MEMREIILPGKETIMTTQDIAAFVRKGYDAFNARQADPHWLDYADEDMADCKTNKHRKAESSSLVRTVS